MRESFVFHAEYIDDLPDGYKAAFCEHTIRYGLYGELPEIREDSLEHALWLKIQRRIDAEAERYDSIKEKRRAAAKSRNADGKATDGGKEDAGAPIPEQDGGEKPAARPGAARFQKPTVEEIKAYCEERGNGIDARAFHDFYESKGWYVGKNRMKDWRASVRTWEQSRKTEQTGGRNKQAGAMWGNESEVPDAYLELV